MKNVLKRCHKDGSVLLVVIGVFVVLMVILASFLKSATSRTHSTKKLGDTMLARELANSLAVASFHYIKNVELKKDDSELRAVLSLPLPYKDTKEKKGDLIAGIKATVTDGSTDIITSLLEKTNLNSIKLDELSWIVNKGDFKPLNPEDDKAPFPREKKGVIRVYMKISYKLPGQKDFISEDYFFVSQVKVAANLFPVISKFNLYVEDAFGGNRPSNESDIISRFNSVLTSAGGKLQDNTPNCPWVLNNGDDDNYCKSYEEFVTSKKGLVYLGGGLSNEPVILGVARGFKDCDTGDFGEDFHFYKKGTGGYWKTHESWGNGEGILAANIGLCDDESTDNLKKWQKLFGAGFRKKSTRNSIFRLFGTDSQISTTLVLGYVNSLFGEARAYKGENGTNKLAHFDDPDDFINYSGLNPDDHGETLSITESFAQGLLSLIKFAFAFSRKTGLDNSSRSKLLEFHSRYETDYATRVSQQRYTKDYTYILTTHEGAADDDRAYPLDYCTNLIKDKLKSLCEIKTDELFEKVPSAAGAEYEKIYKNESTMLTNLDVFLNKEKLLMDSSNDSDKNDRLAQIFEYDEGIGLKNFLKFKSILRKGEDGKDILDPNGWIYIECNSGGDTTIELDGYKVSSQGGIIVGNSGGGKGNIRIKGNITGEHMTIAALDGNITIENAVEKLDASLIAGKGQVKLECSGNIKNSVNLQVKGNIVMKELTQDNITNNFKRVLQLNYLESLAAKPYCDNPSLSGDELERTEFPMLMFDLKEDILMLD